MECPKCSFTHEVFKFCPFCGVKLLSRAGGEGPGPPDSTGYHNSPSAPSTEEDKMMTETDRDKDTTTPTADNSSEDGAGGSPAPRDEQLALQNSQVVTSSANAAEHHGHDKNCRPSTELDKVQKESAYPSTEGQGEDGAKGPGAQVEKGEPCAEGKKEEPGAQVKKEEPGAQVEKGEPGAHVKKEEPGAQVKEEEPGAQVEKVEPGAQVEREEPGAQVEKEEPGAQVEKEEPGAQVEKEAPGAQVKREEPGAQVEKEEPGAQVKKEEPGAKVAKVEKEEPGAQVGKGEHGAQVKKEGPGAQVDIGEQPGAQVKKEEPGTQVKEEEPGAHVEKGEPGAQVKKEGPGAQVEKEEPGAQVEKEEPGAQVKKGGATAKVKKEEPSTQVRKGDPGAKVKKERPGAQVGKGDPGCQVEKEEPGTKGKKEDPGAKEKKEEPGAQVKKEEPGAQVKKEEPGAQVKKEEPGAQAEKEKPGAKAEQGKPGATQNADGKKTCSETDKDVEGKHRHNEKTKEKSKGNGSQEKMSKSQRKRMRKKAKAEKRKNLANPAKKDGDSDRQSTEADETKSQHQQDEEEVDTDQREEEDETGADKMMIYFHVLLRPGDFKYDPDQHHVEVRSNLTKGSQGFTTLVKMSTIGKTNDFLVLEGQKAVSADKVVGKAVEYKYAVVNDKAKGKNHVQWEFIHRWVSHGMITNRCLLIPKDRANPGGVWHQYNDFMLPEESTGRVIFNRVKKAFGLDRAGLIEAKTVAIQMWLPKWRGLYSGDDARHDGKASDALSQIDDVTRGIGGNLIIVQNTQPEVWDPYGFNVNKVIEAYVSRKLDTFHLASEEKQCPTDRLVSALAITYLIRKFGIKLCKEREEVLFEALSLTVDVEKMTCQGLKEVFAHFEPDYIRELPTAIQSLINGALLQANPTPKWLLAIPIYHFLRGDSQPFEQRTEDARVGSAAWFGLGGINFDKLKTNAKWCRPSIKDFLNNISDLLRCDPLLWRTVAAVLELKELEAVCGTRIFTPSESIAALGLTIRRQASRGHLPTSDQQAACRTMEQIAVQCSEESFWIM
ncbi:PREDICTED: E3 ubiquitin-protein ligase rnf213-alpha-like [Branchiostoma belcheri]|uniref:E3 ubiquitin-protein ligase rnf213-alpha-like n=1 Tax=Branchiostoma belcheri TaxID=7741 RepID=A0A6P4ZRB1_BRABE|nr:PREDICTED: E3 ubiquitin-protein ligase rnf213-alpha-like [Branchiostoma belcheri]XP_019643741.1 PREDICTED: E3 ubiquitin-protein ligase rnf213-alpha-like [Branchiostoma belcheri]